MAQSGKGERGRPPQRYLLSVDDRAMLDRFQPDGTVTEAFKWAGLYADTPAMRVPSGDDPRLDPDSVIVLWRKSEMRFGCTVIPASAWEPYEEPKTPPDPMPRTETQC